MKKKAHNDGSGFRSRSADRHSGRRQTPYPHEHTMLVGYLGYGTHTSTNDPDHDGDNDAVDTDGDAAGGTTGAV